MQRSVCQQHLSCFCFAPGQQVCPPSHFQGESLLSSRNFYRVDCHKQNHEDQFHVLLRIQHVFCVSLLQEIHSVFGAQLSESLTVIIRQFCQRCCCCRRQGMTHSEIWSMACEGDSMTCQRAPAAIRGQNWMH